MSKITNEWELALATSHLLWRGTSIVEGAFYYLEQVRRARKRAREREEA